MDLKNLKELLSYLNSQMDNIVAQGGVIRANDPLLIRAKAIKLKIKHQTKKS
jgi:hypothetical protein